MKRDIYYTYEVTHDGEYVGGTADELSRHYSFESAKKEADRSAGIKGVTVCVGRYTININRAGVQLNEDEPANANLYVAYPWRIHAKVGTHGGESVEVKRSAIEVGQDIEFRRYLVPGSRWEHARVDRIDKVDGHDFFFLSL